MRQNLHAAREEGIATTLGHVADGFELAAHAAGTHRGARLAGLTRKGQDSRRNLGHKAQQSGVRVLLRVVVEEAVFVRENQKQVGIQEERHVARKLVVVAHLDFGDGERIVLVDNRNNLARKHRLDGVLQVLVAGAVAKIVGRQKDLPHRELHPAEHFTVGVHEVDLAHGGAGLLFGKYRRLFLVAQLAHAGAHGTACNNHDFLARFHEACDGICKFLDIAGAYTALLGIDQYARADFYHNAMRFV